MAEDREESHLLMLLGKCSDVELTLSERTDSSGKVVELVKTHRIRDVGVLPPEAYTLIFRSLQAGWQRPSDQLCENLRSIFSGVIKMPEYDLVAAGDVVGDAFLIDLCGRFQVGKEDERDFLREILHWAYKSFAPKRTLLRQHIGMILIQYIRAPNRKTNVVDLLKVLQHIIKGFPDRLTKVHLSLLKDVLLPLHEPNDMSVWSTQLPLIDSYHEALVACIALFLDRDPKLVDLVFDAIAATWPGGFQSNTSKEVLLLHEIDMLIKYVPEGTYEVTMNNMLTKVASCLGADNSRVAERALYLFKNEQFIEFLRPRLAHTMRSLMAAMLRGGVPFWNPTVVKMTAHVLESLETMDPVAFATASESIWGHGKALEKSWEGLEMETLLDETPLREPDSSKHEARNTTSRCAMGTWRPGRAGRNTPSSSSSQKPPLTVTGVAPWAAHVPNLARTRNGSFTGISGAMTPPASLKRPLPRREVSEEVARGESRSHRAEHPIGDGGGAEESGSMRTAEHVSEDDTSAGSGLKRVKEFIASIKPKDANGEPDTNWQQQQLEPTPTLLPELRFHHLVFGHEIGHGSFSSVKYARQIKGGKTRSQWPEFAVKIISTELIREQRYEKSVTNEIACLRMLSHPGIARLISAFRWRDGAYLVLEYAARGDLHTHIKDHGSLNETSTRFVIGEVVAALSSIHDAGFVYGDLKPENILITNIGHIKIADFGACRAATEAASNVLKQSRNALRSLRDGDWRASAGLQPDPRYTRQIGRENKCESESDSDTGESGGIGSRHREHKEDAEDTRMEGTAAYMPPEVARGAVPSMSTDAWALGCVTFLCLAGRPPIFAETDEAIMARVVRFTHENRETGSGGRNDRVDLPSETSPPARDMIRVLMEPDLEKRMSVERVAKHDFFMQDGVDVFRLYRQKPVVLAQGSVAPSPDAAWSRRQNSMIWAPMPQEYRLDTSPNELGTIRETAMERDQPFRQGFAALGRGFVDIPESSALPRPTPVS